MREFAKSFHVQDYGLASTLSSGQAFRWRVKGESWAGVVGRRWVRLTPQASGILAETVEPDFDWVWLEHYLGLEVDLGKLLATFPEDEPMQAAVKACRGLRLLRQDPWECLASFILSSTKQIVQIQQIIGLLCERYGDPVATPPGEPPAFAFPSPGRLASAEEADLRACKMGFRAPSLLAVARKVAEGAFEPHRLCELPLAEAREKLVQLPGVGPKIADCVLLFSCGFRSAFPVDVWVMKALRRLYFPGRNVSLRRLQEFAATHFGPNGGYAQQYLFHYARTMLPQAAAARESLATRRKAIRSNSAASKRRLVAGLSSVGEKQSSVQASR